MKKLSFCFFFICLTTVNCQHQRSASPTSHTAIKKEQVGFLLQGAVNPDSIKKAFHKQKGALYLVYTSEPNQQDSVSSQFPIQDGDQTISLGENGADTPDPSKDSLLFVAKSDPSPALANLDNGGTSDNPSQVSTQSSTNTSTNDNESSSIDQNKVLVIAGSIIGAAASIGVGAAVMDHIFARRAAGNQGASSLNGLNVFRLRQTIDPEKLKALNSRKAALLNHLENNRVVYKL